MAPIGLIGKESPAVYTWEDRSQLWAQVRWLIILRWVACPGILAAVLLGYSLDLVRDLPHLFGVPTFLALFNLGLHMAWRRARELPSIPWIRRFLQVQILVDLISLSALIHFSGGIENPFVLFFCFHMAISAMVLPLGMALFNATFVCVLFGLLALGEYAGIIPHHLTVGQGDNPSAHYRTGSIVAGFLVAFVLSQFGTVYFVYSVARRLRRAEELRRDRERLLQARERMAQIGELSAGVAHTVRVPVQGLVNCVDLLRGREGMQGSESEEILDLMDGGLQKIESVIRRLLDATRDEGIRKSRVGLGDVVQASLPFIQIPADAKEIAVEVDVKGAVDANLDHQRISEALINLATNAIDATKAGGSIVIRAGATGDPPRPFLEVQDRGSGIKPEHMEQLCDPFFTTKPVGEGTGLGLAITKQTVEEHDGLLEIDSEEGEGTRVRILLPHEPEGTN